MFKITIPVSVDSVQEAKEGAKFAGYADLLFIGGRVNLGVSKEHFEFLKSREGDSLNCTFKMSICETVDRYKNKSTAFKLDQILEIAE